MSDQNIQVLEKFIDYCSLKNKTISRNLANIGTENYKREDVNFNDILGNNMQNQLTTDNPRHINITPLSAQENESEIINDKKTEGTAEINNVNLEKEMAELAKNTLNYRFSTKKINEYFKLMQSAIRGGNV